MNGPFSIAMLNDQRVIITSPWNVQPCFWPWHSLPCCPCLGGSFLLDLLQLLRNWDITCMYACMYIYKCVCITVIKTLYFIVSIYFFVLSSSSSSHHYMYIYLYVRIYIHIYIYTARTGVLPGTVRVILTAHASILCMLPCRPHGQLADETCF